MSGWEWVVERGEREEAEGGGGRRSAKEEGCEEGVQATLLQAWFRSSIEPGVGKASRARDWGAREKEV